MILETLLLALQPAATAPPPADPRFYCAPRMNMTAAGPPPPVFYAQRRETAVDSEVHLSVHGCGRADYRVERRLVRGAQYGEVEWVPVSQCSLLRAWTEAAGRISLPAPMLRPHANGTAPAGGTWFLLNTHHTNGAGSIVNLELQILEPAEAAPSALSAWFREGERLFKTCRDQGHGGTGYAPRRGPGDWGRE